MEEPAELLSPAGDWECLRAAVAAGADAVYFGLPRFNARQRAQNFAAEDLGRVMDFLHAHGVKGYVTMNVLIFPAELPAAVEELGAMVAAGVDAIIVQDAGLAKLAAEMWPQLRVHGSTQMTVTSPEGVRWAAGLGVRRVVLARELSLRELAKFDRTLPLEVFVHGALCVAYSGQCLTSESLGRRSANRGECAQACRLPYELVVDGATRDLGDRRYLLSPLDLAAVDDLPALLRQGVRSFKIEGRLKSPGYVTAVTTVYRRALDEALAGREYRATPDDWHRMEMTFSRGFFSGWVHGVNHQRLVPALHGKKRGPLAGVVRAKQPGRVVLDRVLTPLKPGDGVVFQHPADTNQETGGRLYAVRGDTLEFARELDLSQVTPGTRVWKTDDPALNRELDRLRAGRLSGRPGAKPPVDFLVEGAEGEPLRLTALAGGGRGTAQSDSLLAGASSRPLDLDILTRALGRLEETPWRLGEVTNRLAGRVFLPVGSLNRVRRAALHALQHQQEVPRPRRTLDQLLAQAAKAVAPEEGPAELAVLCRTPEQIAGALSAGALCLYADFEDLRRYAMAVDMVRQQAPAVIFLATPRIQKAGEQGFFKLIERMQPDGVLLRNVGAIAHFRGSPLRLRGDFSLNVANPLAAAVFLAGGLECVTASCDLNAEQAADLLRGTPCGRVEIILHQHMAMFHMEHCVFAAFLSEGTDHTNCGRPCDRHRVALRDRVGMEHPLRADVGCRNTLFNAMAQTGAPYFAPLTAAGARRFRVELLSEDEEAAARVVRAYQGLLRGDRDRRELWRELQARTQLGVTRGTYDDVRR